MRFKSQTDYEPDSELDDESEAAASEAAAVAEAAPLSEARMTLASLLRRREEALADQSAAREAIARLHQAIGGPAPIEAEIGALDSFEAELIAQWSTSAGEFPRLDAEKRHHLGEALADAKNKAAGAQRAIQAVEAQHARAASKIAGLSSAVAVCISEIILEAVEPDFAAIVEAKARLAALIARAEGGRALALSTLEAIPNRLAIAAAAYSALESVDRTRANAIASPPPSHDRGQWQRLAVALQVDHLAVAEG